jgi:hypothetical protein
MAASSLTRGRGGAGSAKKAENVENSEPSDCRRTSGTRFKPNKRKFYNKPLRRWAWFLTRGCVGRARNQQPSSAMPAANVAGTFARQCLGSKNKTSHHVLGEFFGFSKNKIQKYKKQTKDIGPALVDFVTVLLRKQKQHGRRALCLEAPPKCNGRGHLKHPHKAISNAIFFQIAAQLKLHQGTTKDRRDLQAKCACTAQ